MPFLRTLLERLDPRGIFDRAGTSPYLSRWYLVGHKPAVTTRGNVATTEPTTGQPWQLYVHRFHRGDDDTALHNHPWRSARKVATGLKEQTIYYRIRNGWSPEMAVSSPPNHGRKSRDR